MNHLYFLQESERLRFRKVTIDDLPLWEPFFINNPFLPYLGIDLRLTPKEHAQNWIQLQLDRYEKIGWGHLAVEHKTTGEFIGMGGIIPREIEGRKEFEIAYSLKQEYWKKGYATEIARQLNIFGKKIPEIKRLISIIAKENTPSMRVAEKNDMSPLFETQYAKMDVIVYGTKDFV